MPDQHDRPPFQVKPIDPYVSGLVQAEIKDSTAGQDAIVNYYKVGKRKTNGKMTRLPLPAIAIWLSLGMIAGWWLHVFYQFPTFQTIGINLPNDTSDWQKEQNESLPPLKPGIETLMAQGDYELALEHFGATRSREGRTDQQTKDAIITSLSKLSEKSPEDAQSLLRRFLEESAYDPEGLFLLGKNYFATGLYMNALETLFELKNYTQTAVPEKDIKSLIGQIENEYAKQLRESERFVELLQLYKFLTTRDPSDLARFYKIAKLQYQLHHYHDALTSLNYVLYDPDWRKLAQSLSDDIQQSINLDDDIQVALKRVGDHFVVNANINGVEGARLIIDTGASICVLRPQAAQQFGLPVESDDYITLNLVAGVFNAPRIEIGILSIGDAEVRNVKASVIEMPPSVDSDGLLGMNFLNNFKFFIDQKQDILYLGAK